MFDCDIDAFEDNHKDAKLIKTENLEKQYLDDFDVSDDDEDNINIVISTTKPLTKFPLKQKVCLEKDNRKKKVSLESFGINDGVLPSNNIDLENTKDESKPWRQPGADISDFFNFGFNEETWIQYCNKQKEIRKKYAPSDAGNFMSSEQGLGMDRRSKRHDRDEVKDRYNDRHNKDRSNSNVQSKYHYDREKIRTPDKRDRSVVKRDRSSDKRDKSSKHNTKLSRDISVKKERRHKENKTLKDSERKRSRSHDRHSRSNKENVDSEQSKHSSKRKHNHKEKSPRKSDRVRRRSRSHSVSEKKRREK